MMLLIYTNLDFTGSEMNKSRSCLPRNATKTILYITEHVLSKVNVNEMGAHMSVKQNFYRRSCAWYMMCVSREWR